MTVSEPLTATSVGGGSTSAPAYPDALSGNPSGVGDTLLITCGWGNSTDDDPAMPDKRCAVSNKALTSNVATLTVLAGHGWIAGDVVVIAGVDATFNGTYTLTATTSTSISYAKTASNVASQAATGTATGPDHDLLFIASIAGGGGVWGLNTGPRGHSAWYKISDGTEVGWSASINNGGAGSDRCMRAAIHRCGKSNLTWETPAVVSGTDTTDNTAYNINSGSNPGSAPGDHVFLCASWNTQSATASGVASAIDWAGAGMSGTNFRSTGTVANGNGMRFGVYSGSVTGVSTGNLNGVLTLSAAGSGSALLIRLRDSGTPPGANAGENQEVEPGSPVTLDGSASEGNLAEYHWTQTGGPAVTLSGATSEAYRTFTAPNDVAAGTTLTFTLQTEDVDSNLSNVDTVIVTVMPPTEFIDDGGGTLVPLMLYWEG